MNYRRAHRGAVDGRIRTDFHIVLDHHAADLRHFNQVAIILDETEAVGADHRAIEKRDAIADRHALADRDVAMAGEVVADRNVGINRHVRMDRRALSDLYAAAYDTVSANRNVVAGNRAGSHNRSGMNSGGWAVWRKKYSEHAGEVEDWIRALERRAFRLCDEVGGDDCGCGRGRAQRCGVFCSGGENNCARAGRFDRHRRQDLNLPVTAKLESQLRSQFLQFHPIAPLPGLRFVDGYMVTESARGLANTGPSTTPFRLSAAQ